MSGVAAVAAIAGKLDLVRTLDRGIGPIKQRDRGATGGQLLFAVAQSQLFGADAMVGLDRHRPDPAMKLLSAVPTLPSTTAAGLARRFTDDHLQGVEAGIAALVGRYYRFLLAKRRVELTARVTIDMDSTDVEVYGSRKQGMAYNYAGQRCGRPHLAIWAEAGLSVAADLLAGNDDVRPRCADLLERALAAVPKQVRTAAANADRLRIRADAGYFTAELAHAAVTSECDFAVAAKRNTAMWRAYATIPDNAWVDAIDMHGAQVAAVDYAPGGWPEGTYTIVRRVRIDAQEISADSRSRRRRTIHPDQLALALDGVADHAWAVSFIATNIPTYLKTADGDTVRQVEAWFRQRTDIEDRIREAKLGAALRHLPSGHHRVNRVWMWGALIAGNISVMLQALTGIDKDSRARGARLRHELLCVPARLVRHGRSLILRLPTKDHLLPTVLDRIRNLTVAA